MSLRGGRTDEVDVQAVDLRDRDRALSALEQFRVDAVAHLAASIPQNGGIDQMQSYFDDNVSATSTITTFCRLRSCPLVYASSTSVYGSMAGGVPRKESSTPAPESLYALSKYVGELQCRQLSRAAGVPTTALRISAPYGPGNRRNVICLFIQAALRSRDLTVFGTGTRTQDFTYGEDVAAAVERALDQHEEGVFNIASGQPVSMLSLAEAVLAAVPRSRSRIVVGGSDTQADYRADVDVSAARDHLGWRAETSLAAGLAATAASLERDR